MRTYIIIVTILCLLITLTTPLTAKAVSMPGIAPSITGQITDINIPIIIVEEYHTGSSDPTKVSVRITEHTQISRKNQDIVNIAELRMGQKVKIWFIGPVLESYPLQATADVIIIESNSH